MNASLRRMNPDALIKGAPFVALRVGDVFRPNGKVLPNNITDVAQLHEMVAYFEKSQRPSGEWPLIDFDHAATGELSMLQHPEARIPLGAIVGMRVVADGLEVDPVWTKRGRTFVAAAEGLLRPSAHYAIGDLHDRATGKRVSGGALLAVAITPMPATRPDQLGEVRAAPPGMMGVGVAYVLPADIAAAWPGIVGAPAADSPPHVTIAYMLIEPSALAGVVEAARKAIALIKPFRVRITGGVHTFPPTPEGTIPLVAAVQSEGALAAHQHIMAEVRTAGFAVEETHIGYVPHATLGYVSGDAYEFTAPSAADLVAGELEIWPGEGTPIPVQMTPAPDGASKEAARAAGGWTMTKEELVAALKALSAEELAAVLAEVSPAADPAAAEEARAAEPVPGLPEEAARSLRELTAWKAKMEKAQADAAELAAVNSLISRGAVLPAAEHAARAAFRSGGAAWKYFQDLPSNAAFQGGGPVGERATVLDTNAKVPPATDEGFVAFALRNIKEGESQVEALERCRREHPAVSAVVFGDKGGAR